jgi:hypothetical protein
MDSGGPQKQVKALFSPEDPLLNFSVQTLTRLGFLKPEQKPITMGDRLNDPKLTPTQLVDLLVSILFDSKDLMPEAIGKKQWRNDRIICIYSEDITKHSDLIGFLENCLRKLRLQSTNSITRIPTEPSFLISSSDIIILCLDRRDEISPYSMKSFLETKHIKTKKIIKILVEKSADEKPYDPFPEVPSLGIFDFSMKDKSEVERFEKLLEKEFPDK